MHTIQAGKNEPWTLTIGSQPARTEHASAAATAPNHPGALADERGITMTEDSVRPASPQGRPGATLGSTRSLHPEVLLGDDAATPRPPPSGDQHLARRRRGLGRAL